MVSGASLFYMVISMILSVILPLGLVIYLGIKKKISLKSVLVGALTFILFVMILERLLHTYVFTINPSTMKLFANPWLYAIYGSLAAGLFEEGGRFISFKLLLKKNREWYDGISFGFGHGGIEAILIGGISQVQNLILSLFINSGTLEAALGTSLSPEAIAQVKSALVNTPSYMFALGGIERLFALAAQIGFTLIVLYSIRKKKFLYLLAAIIAHAILDFPVALAQKQVLGIFTVELTIAVIAIVSVVFIFKSRKLFEKI